MLWDVKKGEINSVAILSRLVTFLSQDAWTKSTTVFETKALVIY